MKEFKFYRSLNKIGYYGKVRLEVSLIEDTGLKITYDDYVEVEWRNSVEFAARYFYEHYSIENKKGLIIHVAHLHTMIIDTSSIVVFYIVVKCLCEAVNYEPDLVVFGEDGRFILLK